MNTKTTRTDHDGIGMRTEGRRAIYKRMGAPGGTPRGDGWGIEAIGARMPTKAARTPKLSRRKPPIFRDWQGDFYENSQKNFYICHQQEWRSRRPKPVEAFGPAGDRGFPAGRCADVGRVPPGVNKDHKLATARRRAVINLGRRLRGCRKKKRWRETGVV